MCVTEANKETPGKQGTNCCIIQRVNNSSLFKENPLTLSAPNDVDLRFAVFLLWAKRRRSTSKYLNFPPYYVIGITLKSINQSGDRIWYVLKEENLSYLFIA
jgi:hypothetical protein